MKEIVEKDQPLGINPMLSRRLTPYGSELKYSGLANVRGKIVYAVCGEIHQGFLSRYLVNRRYLNKYLESRDIHILELGSANGVFSFWLSRNEKHKVVALEISKTLVDDCEDIRRRMNRNNLSFICGDASTEFTQKDPFDMIFATHVLEHIQDDRAVLINAFKALRPGGLLFIQVPYGDPNKEPSKEDAIGAGHVREGYSEEDLRSKLESAGLEVISITGCVGRIGRFACRVARKAKKLRLVFTLFFLLSPFIIALIYLEQVAAFLRREDLPFEHGPLVIARRPL